jgi:hypothetical protein
VRLAREAQVQDGYRAEEVMARVVAWVQSPFGDMGRLSPKGKGPKAFSRHEKQGDVMHWENDGHINNILLNESNIISDYLSEFLRSAQKEPTEFAGSLHFFFTVTGTESAIILAKENHRDITAMISAIV